MAKHMDINARLAGGMRFDMATGEGGEGAGPQPMEMLLVGLAGCAGMSNLLILRKRKQDVSDYEIRVHGERAEAHPQVFTEITVEHVITGRQIKPEMVEQAMLLTEQKYCGASAMLEKAAHISHIYKIVEVE